MSKALDEATKKAKKKMADKKAAKDKKNGKTDDGPKVNDATAKAIEKAKKAAADKEERKKKIEEAMAKKREKAIADGADPDSIGPDGEPKKKKTKAKKKDGKKKEKKAPKVRGPIDFSCGGSGQPKAAPEKSLRGQCIAAMLKGWCTVDSVEALCNAFDKARGKESTTARRRGIELVKLCGDKGNGFKIEMNPDGSGSFRIPPDSPMPLPKEPKGEIKPEPGPKDE